MTHLHSAYHAQLANRQSLTAGAQSSKRASERALRTRATPSAASAEIPASVQAPVKKESKRQRVVKQQIEIPDSWVQKGTRVLDGINKQKFSQWFREPVRPTATFVPDYFSIVKSPMDLGTAREKLRAGQYDTPLDFAKVRRRDLAFAQPPDSLGSTSSITRRMYVAVCASVLLLACSRWSCWRGSRLALCHASGACRT